MPDIEGKSSRRRYIGKRSALIRSGMDPEEAARRARSYAGGKHTTRVPQEVTERLSDEALTEFLKGFLASFGTDGDETRALEAGWEQLRSHGFVQDEQGRWVAGQDQRRLEMTDDVRVQGWIRLSDWIDAAALVDLDAMEAGEPASQIQILRTGIWEHPVFGTIEITEQTLQDFVDNFYAGLPGTDIAVDQSHQPDQGAAGWFRDLYKRGTELWADIGWTPMGVQLIRDEIFRYFSPEFDVVYTDAETGEKTKNVLRGGGLTNRPFIRGMAPVMLSETILATVPQQRAIPRAGKESAMPIQLSEAVATRLNLARSVEPDALIAALETAFQVADAADAERRQLAEQNTALNAANQELNNRVTALEAGLRTAEWERYRDGQIREGRLTMALAETFQPLFLSDPDQAKKIIAALPRIDLTEHGSRSADSAVTDQPADKRFLAEITAYQREHKVSFTEAYRAVAAEKPDLAREYLEVARQ